MHPAQVLIEAQATRLGTTHKHFGTPSAVQLEQTREDLKRLHTVHKRCASWSVLQADAPWRRFRVGAR